MRVYCLALTLVLAGCADDAQERIQYQANLDTEAEVLSQSLEASANTGLNVRLAFSSEVDLDLYVTGPLLETVYFANHSSKSGGKIVDDIRCDSEGERIEKVVFEAPMPGRYRVGVDFPKRCAGESAPAPYAVLVEYPGHEMRKNGTVHLEQFDVAVMEFEIE